MSQQTGIEVETLVRIDNHISTMTFYMDDDGISGMILENRLIPDENEEFSFGYVKVIKVLSVHSTE